MSQRRSTGGGTQRETAPRGQWADRGGEWKEAEEPNRTDRRRAIQTHGGPPAIRSRASAGIMARQVREFMAARAAYGQGQVPRPLSGVSRERFASGTSQGDDEDWPPDAPISIADTTAVAKTHGDVAVRTSLGKEIDIHEILKRHAFASPNPACDNHFEKNRPCPDAIYGSSDQYVSLDSWVRSFDRSQLARGVISWKFMIQGVTHDEYVGVRDTIDTVTEMQIGSFTIPNFFPAIQMQNPYNGKAAPGFPRLTLGTDLFPESALSATFGFFPYVGRITIEFIHLNSQAIFQFAEDGGTIRYHFEADVIPIFPTQGSLSTSIGGAPANNPPPVALRVVPLPGFDTWKFTDPIRDIYALTVVFRSVDKYLQFPEDVLLGGKAFTDSTIYPFIGFSFQINDQLDQGATFRYLNSALAAASTQVMFSGVKTGNAAIDNWINQAPGLVASIPPGFAPGVALNSVLDTVNPIPSVVRFTIAPQVDITPLVPTPPAPGTRVDIPSANPITARFATARIRIPMRFRRVVQRLTNYS